MEKMGKINYTAGMQQHVITTALNEQARMKSVFGPTFREVEVGRVAFLAKDKPLKLDSGAEISDFPMAYQTYGTLNGEKSNAILACHGLTADQYIVGPHPVTGKAGWWEHMVGPGRVFDTDKYFVISINVIGGCMGSFGPKEINPVSGKRWGLSFPVITIADMVRAQALLLDHLGIERLFCVIGGSMGGMQALTWAALYPDRVFSAVPIASSIRHSAQNIAFHEIGRQAIMADPDWCGGDYIEQRRYPAKGLAVARMTAHVTYLSEHALGHKFGRNLQGRENISFGFDADFQVESYLRHQGQAFVERFDANSYLYITRAVDYFDLSEGHNSGASDLFRGTKTRFCIISFSSDWLFPSSESRALVRALNSVAANVSFTEIQSDKGHDAFLLDEPEFEITVRRFLDGVARHRGIA